MGEHGSGPSPLPPPRAWVLAAALTVAVAGLGGALTDIGPWYRSLVQPPWKPPDWAFGPAWTLIYALTAWAGVRTWWASPTPRQRRQVLAAYAANAALNVLWSALFFWARRPDWALFEVGLLAASVALLIALAAPVDRRAARALWPYQAWVVYAASINAGVWALNPEVVGAGV